MHELIVGGAGSGKTAELASRYEKEQNALFLSRRGITPYKLALDIVTSVEGKVPEPERESGIGEKKSCFSSRKEYDARLAVGAPVSFCGEEMKSFGETDIANFLFESKVDYIYEHPYKIDTATAEFSQYRPDFYLPEYDIYIEYFALDRDGNAPEHFADGYAASEKWKKELHAKNKTKLIALYAYERDEGKLVDSLKKQLKCGKVKLRHRRRGELYPKGASYTEQKGAADFAPILKKAAEYARSGAYKCPYSHIFADDIDLFGADCAELLRALPVPVTASARSKVFGEKITRLDKKYRTPKYDFVFSHTKDGERAEMIKRLTSFPNGAVVFIIGKRNDDALLLAGDCISLSYNRAGECVNVKLPQNSGVRVYYLTASRVEGSECDHALVLADTFSYGDEREFETAVTRAKKSVLILSKTGEESPLAKDLRGSLGVKESKKGFECPKCGSPLTVVNGKYGDFLGCTNYKGGCDYKRKM